MPSLQDHVPKDEHNQLMRATSQATPKAENHWARLAQDTERASCEPLESFFEACGGAQSIALAVRRVENRGTTETYAFQQPFVVIGSCAESDLVMPDRSVNYRHVY